MLFSPIILYVVGTLQFLYPNYCTISRMLFQLLLALHQCGLSVVAEDIGRYCCMFMQMRLMVYAKSAPVVHFRESGEA